MTKFYRSMIVLVLMLLATGLAVQQLNVDAFSSDEVASMIVAGGAHFGPFSLTEAWNKVAENSPDQAMGLALVLSLWGKVVGWTEFATRSLEAI